MDDVNIAKPQMAMASDVLPQPQRRIRLKDHVVNLGIQAFCGKNSTLTAAVAAEIPFGYAAIRFLWLRALHALGRQTLVARGAFGHEYLCHLGDVAEFPYYHPRAYRRELILCAQWLEGLEHPVVYDVGANSGFFVTQLAQMTAKSDPLFYAFEAAPETFSKLVASIQRLGLEHSIRPVAGAVLDEARKARLNYSGRNSLLSQVVADDEPPSADSVTVKGITLDAFCATSGEFPSLLKVDVEGWEPAVLRGARNILERHRPVIAFEHNPARGCKETADLLRGGALDGYQLHYVDDLQGQVRPFGSAIDDIRNVGWICNLFAVPEERRERWLDTITLARARV